MIQTTKGQARVKVGFNPSEDTYITRLKEGTAKLIDSLEALQFNKDEKNIAPEFNRLKAIAQTKYEEACMWAVKCRTLHTDFPSKVNKNELSNS